MDGTNLQRSVCKLAQGTGTIQLYLASLTNFFVCTCITCAFVNFLDLCCFFFIRKFRS